MFDVTVVLEDVSLTIMHSRVMKTITTMITTMLTAMIITMIMIDICAQRQSLVVLPFIHHVRALDSSSVATI